MKTIAIILVLSLSLSYNDAVAFVQEVDFEIEEELFIDDIPFDTKAIIDEINSDGDTNETGKKGNAINAKTIPNKEYYLAGSIDFELEDEEYIDDIPFDTEVLFNSMVNFNENDKNVIVHDFCLADEEYVDDIPFDTRQVILERMAYPEFARETGTEGSVCVCVKYDENGYLKVVQCNCSNTDLRDYVVSVLQSIRLREGIVSLDKEYILRFNFRSI